MLRYSSNLIYSTSGKIHILLEICSEFEGKVTSNKTDLAIPTGDGMNSIKGKETAFQTLGKNFIQDTLKASEHWVYWVDC